MSAETDGPVAAIDCGTNSTRLIVVAADGEVLEREMRITRLGEGVDSTHRLAPAAIARTVSVLEEYKQTMDAHDVVGARLVATSATRDASNSHDFFAAAELATGLVPELLSGDEEGRLSFLGSTADLPPELVDGNPLLVVDIGGGSTELVVGRPALVGGEEVAAPGDTVRAISVDVGCVRVSERFFLNDPPLEQQLGGARDFVTAALIDARRNLPPLSAGGIVVGLAGTVSTIASLERQVAEYSRAAIHHVRLSRQDVRRWTATLEHEDSAARLARPGMVPGREDVIAGGALVLDAVMDVFDRRCCLVSEDDILDGLAESVRQRRVRSP